LKKGGQRAFLDLVVDKLKSPSLRGLLQFGFVLKYSTLKNYYSEVRLMPRDLVEDFCELAGVDIDGLDVGVIGENWGQVKGGKVRKISLR